MAAPRLLSSLTPSVRNLLPLYTRTVKQCGAAWGIRWKLMTILAQTRRSRKYCQCNSHRVHYWKTTSSTKPEVHDIFHRRQMRTEPRPLCHVLKISWFGRVVFSEHELTFSFAICCRPSVCRLSVTLVHPTQPVEIFGNLSRVFGTLAIR